MLIIDAIILGVGSARAIVIDLLISLAPLVLGVVVGLASLRLVLKLFNRSVGK